MVVEEEHTTPQSIAAKTKAVLMCGVVPNMRLRNIGTENGFTSVPDDYLFWLSRVCGD